MAQATQPYRRSLSGSIGAGMKSVFGGGGRTYYMLVHKVSSKYHKAGESQPIIVDEIEIGRGSQCQVRFDDSFTTVSRRHAAIVRDGDKWKLIQLSTTNSTYLNGQKVHKEWYLQNGDEIQLSTNGPKLGFIIPEGEKGKVSSIGLTARLNLFRKQALRPYKTALTILSCVLLLAIAGLVWMGIHSRNAEKQYEQWKAEQEELNQKMIDSIEYMRARYDTLQLKYFDMAESNSRMQKQVNSMRKQIKNLQGLTSSELKAYEQYVYYIEVAYMDITFPDGSTVRTDQMRWSGSGFLLDDGSFVTARHVAKAWYHWSGNSTMGQLRDREYNQKYKVVAYFVAVSSSGDELYFSSNDFRMPSGYDAMVAGVPLCVCGQGDWAYIPNKKPAGKGLKCNKQKSLNMEKNTKLTIIGFPFGFGVERSHVEPPVSEAKVAKDKLMDGAILTTDNGSEHGNSGGPVFYMTDAGKLEVIGLISGGTGNNTGVVTPIGNLK